MAEAFGPLESFRALTTDDTGEDAYPLGHDATRTAGMDAGVWEIKWEHRDEWTYADSDNITDETYTTSCELAFYIYLFVH